MSDIKDREEFLFREQMLTYLDLIAERLGSNSSEGSVSGSSSSSSVGVQSSQIELLKNIDKNLTSITDQSKNSTKLSLSADLATLTALAEVTSDRSSQKTMKASFDMIAGGVTKIANAAERADKFKDVLGSISELASKGKELAMAIAKPVGLITLSLVGLGLAITMFGGSKIVGGLLAITAIIGVLALTAIAIKRFGVEYIEGITDLSKGIAILSIALAIVSMFPSMNIMGGLMIVSSAALIISVASRIAGKSSGEMKDMAMGIAILAGSLIIMSVAAKFISPQEFMMAGLALLGMVGVAALASKISSPKNARDLGVSMMAISGALIITALGVKMFEMMNVSWKTVGIAIVTMLGLAAAVAIIGKVGKDVLKGAISMIVIVAALALVPMVLELYKTVNGEDLVKPGIVLTALVVATIFVGKSDKYVLKGAFAMLVMVAALWAIPPIVERFRGLNWEDMGKAAAALGGLTIAVVVLGKSSATAILGAVAMGIIAGSLWVISKALMNFNDIEWNDLGKAAAAVGGLMAATIALGFMSPIVLIGSIAMMAMGGALWVVGKALNSVTMPKTDFKKFSYQLAQARDAVISIGSPWAFPKIMFGAAAASSIGMGLANVSLGMKMAEKVDMSKAVKAAKGIMSWARYTIKSMGSLGFGEMIKAKMGLWSMSQLGTALTSLALGVSAMASGTYKEYGLDADGNVKVIAVHRLTDRDYAMVGVGIQKIVDATAKPLAKFGSGGGLLTDSDTYKGVNNLYKLGNSVVNLAKGTIAMANGTYKEYGIGEDGKVKVIGIHKLTSKDYANVGISIGKIIDSISKPLAKFGSGGGMFTDSDTYKGVNNLNLLSNSIAKMAKGAMDIAKGTYKEYDVVNGHVKVVAIHKMTNKDYANVGISIGKIIDSLSKPLAKFGSGGGMFTDSDTYKGVQNMTTLSYGLSKIIRPIKQISELNSKQLNVYPFIKSFSTLTAQIKKPLADLSAMDSKAVENMKVVSDTAKAMGIIANADLSSLAKHNYESQRNLFDKLDDIADRLVTGLRSIQVQAGDTTKFDEEQKKLKQKQLEEADEPVVTLETISLQIDDLIKTLKMKR